MGLFVTLEDKINAELERREEEKLRKEAEELVKSNLESFGRSDELRNFVEIVKKEKHKAAKNGKITAKLNDLLFGSAMMIAPTSPIITIIIWRIVIFSFNIIKAKIVVITGPIM